MQPSVRTVAVLDLLLNRENPRHVPKNGQQEVINYLLADEEVYNLARHMSQHGINPLELTAVFSDEDGNLVVAEGNRRVCAAQLLTDPEKAPDDSRARFRALAAKGRDVSQMLVMEFPDYETAQPWLQVLHDGEQDGVGRKRWKPEQKARATTNKSKDALAVALTDYAERQGIVTPERRPSLLLSTVTRYLANPGVRRAMALASLPTSDKVVITTDTGRFHSILADFYEGISSKQLHSRSKTPEWEAYARKLEDAFGAASAAVPPIDVTDARPTSTTKPRATRARIVPPETRFIAASAAVISGLNKLKSLKLSSLYHSLTNVRLDEHPALLTTGAWVFVEALTALHGRDRNSEFVGYLNSRFGGFGIKKDAVKDCRLSLEYIQSHGNAEKHSAKFSAIDARNLNGHFQVLEDVFVALISECIAASGMKK